MTLSKFRELVIPIHRNNLPSVQLMLKHAPNIEVTELKGRYSWRPHEEYKNSPIPVLSIGLGHPTLSEHYRQNSWDQASYDQAKVPLDNSWSHFYCYRDFEAESNLLDRVRGRFDPCHKVFLHEDPSRKFIIRGAYKKLNHVSPDRSETPYISHWISTIQECDEIHCIPSSFSLLIDRIPLPKNPKLFLHAYARPKSRNPFFRKQWQWI